MSTIVLKMNIHCKGCERKAKRLLKKIYGVRSVTIDVDQERVTIVATVDPNSLIDTLKNAGFKPELVQDNSIPIPKNSNLQIVATDSRSDQTTDERMVTQLQKLSKIEDIQNVEITYSKTIKLNFKAQNDDPLVDKKNNKLVYVNGSQIDPSGNSNRPNGPSVESRGPCCGGHGTSHGNGGHCRGCIHSLHGHGNDYWGQPSCGCSIPPAPPPLWQRDVPSAPPAVDQTSGDYGHNPPSPSMGYPSYSYVFKDDDYIHTSPPVRYPSYPYVPQDDDRSNMCKLM